MTQNNSTQANVLITGAGSGIGRATALYLANNGFRVFAGVRKEADGEKLRSECYENLEPLLLDVTSETSRQQVLVTLTTLINDKGLYGLINNAGVSYCSPLEYVDEAHIDKQFRTNVYGPLLTTQALLPLIRIARGRVINISSGSGQLAIPLVGVYSGTKFALEGISDALRVELRQWGIHVSVVAPGFIETPIQDKNQKDMEELLQRLPCEGKERYSKAIHHYIKQNKKMARSATTPETVAKVIYTALTSKKPKTRYAAGRDAAMLSLIRRILSDRMKDKLVAAITGL